LTYFVYLKEFDGLYVAKNFGKSSAKKNKGKIFRKNQLKKIPKSLNSIWGKNPRIPRKIAGIF
jgi:hypothetical protein